MFQMQIFILFAIFSSSFSAKFIELNHDLDDTSPILPLPGFEPFKLETISAGFRTLPDGNGTFTTWIAQKKFSAIEHIGTHIDAPFHFYENGWKVDEIPLERLFAPAAVIDIRRNVAKNPFYELSVEDVQNWIDKNGMFLNNSAILVNTGWSKKYSDPVEYIGSTSDILKLKFPGLSLEAVRKILGLKKTHGIHVVAFGIDAISLSTKRIKIWKVHREICSQNIYIIENLANLESLPAKGSRIMVMPLKIKGGTGAPSRVIANLNTYY